MECLSFILDEELTGQEVYDIYYDTLQAMGDGITEGAVKTLVAVASFTVGGLLGLGIWNLIC
jgi:hypothetical protein